MTPTAKSNLTCPHCGCEDVLLRLPEGRVCPRCGFAPASALGHEIGCRYWRDMDNGSPSITCTCGLWAAERQEIEAELGCPCVGTADQEDCPHA